MTAKRPPELGIGTVVTQPRVEARCDACLGPIMTGEICWLVRQHNHDYDDRRMASRLHTATICSACHEMRD